MSSSPPPSALSHSDEIQPPTDSLQLNFQKAPTDNTNDAKQDHDDTPAVSIGRYEEQRDIARWPMPGPRPASPWIPTQPAKPKDQLTLAPPKKNLQPSDPTVPFK